MATKIPLYERLDVFVPHLLESTEVNGVKRMKVEGVVQKADFQNKNGRIYPKKLWETVLNENSAFTRKVKNREVMGQLEHPEKGCTKLPEVSHLVENVWLDGDEVKARFLILNTPSGKIVEELFNVGIPVKVSSRANGEVESRDGKVYVKESGFDLDTFDFVYNPSVSVVTLKVLHEAAEELFKKGTPAMDMKDSLKLIQEGEVLVSGTKLEGMTITSLIEHSEKIATLITSLSSVVEECQNDANITKGKLMTVLPQIKSKITSLAESITVSTGKDSEKDKVITEMARENLRLKKMLESDTLIPKSKAVAKIAKLLEEVDTIKGNKGNHERAKAIVAKLLEHKDRAVDIVAKLLEQKDRGIKIVAKLLESQDKSTVIIESYKNKLSRSNGLLEAVVAKSRKLCRDKFLAEEFTKTPELKKFEEDFKDCDTVVKCRGKMPELMKKLEESRKTSESVPPATKVVKVNESTLPKEGDKGTSVTGTVKKQHRGFMTVLLESEMHSGKVAV